MDLLRRRPTHHQVALIQNQKGAPPPKKDSLLVPLGAEFSEEEQQRHNPNAERLAVASGSSRQIPAITHRTSQCAGHKCEVTQLHSAESEFRRMWRHCLPTAA